MGGVSDVVTPFDLPYQAKAALCSYVPKLRKTYNARELDDEHPLRLTNQAATFDHSDDREHEFNVVGSATRQRDELLDTAPYQPRATRVVVRYPQRRREGGRDTAPATPEELGTSRLR